MSPLYIRTILKDVSASLCIQRILAIASSGREREARSSSKATKFGGPPGENEFPGGDYSPIKVTGVLMGKFQEHGALKCTRILFYGRVPNSFPPLIGTNSTTLNLYNRHCRINSNKNNFRTLSSQGVFESIVINLYRNQSF